MAVNYISESHESDLQQEGEYLASGQPALYRQQLLLAVSGISEFKTKKIIQWKGILINSFHQLTDARNSGTSNSLERPQISPVTLVETSTAGSRSSVAATPTVSEGTNNSKTPPLTQTPCLISVSVS